MKADVSLLARVYECQTCGEISALAPMPFIYGNQKGMALCVALMFMGVLSLLGTTAVLTTTTDLRIGSNFRDGEQAFYTAQSGAEEARARLRGNASFPVKDDYPARADWRAYVGGHAKARDKGYDWSNGLHARHDSLQSRLDYTVLIRHQTDGNGNVLYWGDVDGDGVNERNVVSGENIYVVTSFGSAAGSNKTVEVEVARIPPISVPSALYVEATATLQGDDTHIIGTDGCGGADKPGMVITEDREAVSINSGPEVTGAGGTDPDIVYNGTNMDMGAIVSSHKNLAGFSYTVDSAVHTETTTPGPGDGWGSPVPGPTPQDPSSCSGGHVVHYDTGGTYVRLAGGVYGCGVLLVEGDLEVEGPFSWYGLIVVTGSVVFTGPGDRNITGGVMAGGSAVVDATGGNTNIVYCSSAIADQMANLPVSLLAWKEEM